MIFDLMGGYEYRLHEREPEGIEGLLRNEPFDGLNVTIPYKKDVIPYLDEVDPLARRLGSVNTIVKRNGHLSGYNSDYYGFSSMVYKSGIAVAEKKVLVLGSGGASVTVQAVLRDMGANVVVISRSGANHYGNLHLHTDASVIVNTSPVGMYPNNGASPVDLTLFPRLEGVLDLIYNPARTQLLLDAERLGIPCMNGLWMLVAQAKKSAEWFMDRELPDSLIADIHHRLRDKMENVALIGMAGCGKSRIGAMLAEATGKTFVDADDEIVKLAEKTIPEIFTEDGEEIFRQLETQVLEDLGKQSGLIIATGGGCVTKQRNYRILHQNSSIFWLERDLSLLPTDGRPLSQAGKLRDMYEIRKPLYETFADYRMDNNGSPLETVRNIILILEGSL
jgi:shikimate dehydrogenase